MAGNSNNNTPTEEDFKDLKSRLEYIFKADPDQEHNDHSIRRFLRAFKTVDGAFTALLKHNKWRREYGVDSISPDEAEIKKEIDSKKIVICPHRDIEGRPVIYVAVRKHDVNNRDLDQFTRYIVYQLENACKRCYEDVIDNLCIVFDLKDFGLSCMDYQFVKNLIWLLSRHYPERLGVCLIWNAPSIFSGCWNIIKQSLDEVTANKVIFVNDEMELCKYLHPDILPSDDDDDE